MFRRLWNSTEIDFLKKHYSKMTNKDLSKALNRSICSVEKKLERLGLNNEDRHRQEATTKQFNEANIDLIIALKEKLQLQKIVPPNVPKLKPEKKGDTLVVHFTDWHIGRLVKDEDGNEVYNTPIFESRINKLLEEILYLLDSYIRKGTPISDVVIISTGDILDGMGIFASQEVQSELSPPFQVMKGIEVIQKFILALLERDLAVKFYGVRGNHGEIRGEKGKTKDPNANWDMQLYLILDFWAKNILKNNRIQVYYSELDYLNFEIKGWRYHIRHIAPQQSDTAAGKAKFLGWAKKHKCDVLVYGHFHHYGFSDRSRITVMRGGSVTGEDEYTEQLAEESEPIQTLWGCSKKRPVTFMYAIDLGERKKR